MKLRNQENYAVTEATLVAGLQEQKPRTAPNLEKIIQLAEMGDFKPALAMLEKPTLDSALRNALGVCNLRMGRPAEAIRLFRELVLVSGGGWNKPHTPPIYKTNFAIALLLAGHPCGAKEMLSDVNDESHPSVIRVRQAMKAWEGTLTTWQWLNWKLFLLEPRNRPVTLDFTPGDFVDPREQTGT